MKNAEVVRGPPPMEMKEAIARPMIPWLVLIPGGSGKQNRPGEGRRVVMVERVRTSSSEFLMPIFKSFQAGRMEKSLRLSFIHHAIMERRNRHAVSN